MEGASLGDRIRRVLFQRSFEHRSCTHLGAISQTETDAPTCRACEAEGTKPFHLRMCLVCGEVACCDSSKAQHARRHHEETGHPLIRSVEDGEDWAWCYTDQAYLWDVL